ncbi:hypothetical protein ACHAPD_006776 [Fusarium lateritium]
MPPNGEILTLREERLLTQQPETPTSSMALVEVGSPEAVEPHHMKNASAYLEEQYPKYTYVPDQNSPPEAIAIEPDKEKQHELDGKTVSPKRTVFGIRRRWFVIGVVVALIVIAAAIGGGVGGSMAHKNKKDDAEAEAATFTSSVGQGDSTDEASQATSASTSALVVTKTITETAADSTQSDNHLIGQNHDNDNKDRRSNENDGNRNRDNRVLRRGNGRRW